MTRKEGILSELHEDGFLKYNHLKEGLAANDRAKYYFALLGLAQCQAENPVRDPDDLKGEREKVGIDAAWLDEVIPQARKADRLLMVPRSKDLLGQMTREVGTMVQAVASCDAASGDPLTRRFHKLEKVIAATEAEAIPSDLVGDILSGNRSRKDGLHILVMDAHKALNRLGRELSEDKVDGAAVYGLADGDRARVAAFMKGVNRTSPLRFDHPGLDTTAMRLKTHLLIQNDIGETDAHVFLCAVREDTVEITYTDVHEKRSAFFQSTLSPLGAAWETRSVKQTKDLPESSQYYLLRGEIPYKTPEALHHILTEIGAKLAFLIDWNKARKRLRVFVKGKDAIRILQWDAREEIGHMGFLKLGGKELIYEALELAEPGAIRPGEPLYQVLGKEATIGFLMQVLQLTSTGLLNGEPELLICDRVKAAFVQCYRTRSRGPLASCRDLTGLVVESAMTVRDMLRALSRDDHEFVKRSAQRVNRWEEESDVILNGIRKGKRDHNRQTPALTPAVFIDDAQDALEEAAHVLLLIEPESLPGDLRFGLEEAADLSVRAAQEGYKAVAAAEGTFDATGYLEDFSHSIDRLDTISHAAQSLRRNFRKTLLAAPDLGSVFTMLVMTLAGELTKAARSLARAGFALHSGIFESPAGERMV